MKRKRLGIIYLIIAFIIVTGLTVGFFVYAIAKNKNKEEYKGIINKTYKDYSVTIKIPEGKSWVNNEGSSNQNYGEQFDFRIIDSTKFDLNNWTLIINFYSEKFELIEIDSCWNVIPVVDGNKLTLTPETNITLKSVKPSETNAFGFVFLVKNEITEDDFSDFNFILSGTPYRHITSYITFWACLLLVFSYIAFLIAYIVFRLRERHFEMFKKHTYNIISQSMNTFASLIDVKDPYTKDHSARVSYYSVKIARKLGLDEDFIRNIAYIALMHDCGKLLVDDDILGKPSKLTEEEYEIMKTHTTNGGRALENFTSIKGIQDGAMYHHERYDGTGYPEGLSGEDIPLCARIIGVADALDAMSSDRCYRKRLTEEAIKNELIVYSGSQFDPKIAKLVVEMIDTGEIDISENRKDAD